MPEILYRENKTQYHKRTAFSQVLSLLILASYFFALFITFQYQIPISSNDQKVMIIILFIILTLISIYLPLLEFSNRILIIKDDMIYPPKVPIKYITKKKNYTIDYRDIIWFKVTTSPKGEIEGILIKHPDFFLIDIHIPEFPIEAVLTSIEQLRKNTGQKEKKIEKGIA